MKSEKKRAQEELKPQCFPNCLSSLGLVLLVCLHFQDASAQGRTGILTGLVKNKSTEAAVVPANISIIGSTFGTTTDSAGRFTIKSLPAGTYEVSVSALGFAPLIARGVAVSDGGTTEITVPLEEQLLQVQGVETVGSQVTNIPELNVSTRFLDYREIQHTAGSFDDVLRTITILPGVAQTRVDRNDLSVRGGSPAENLFIVDGIELDNINHFGTEGSGGGSTTFLNLDFVENSFFSGGGFGVPYGDRLSSVLSVTMRDGRTDQSRGKATISATQLGLDLDGPFADRGTYLFSARRSYLDPLFRLSGFAYAPYFYDFLGKATYRFGNADKLEILGIGVMDRILRFDENQQQIDDNNRSLLGEQTRAIAGMTWKHGFEFGYLSVAGWHDYLDFDYQLVGVGKPNIHPFFRDASRENESSLRADLTVQPFSATTISSGLEFKSARLYTHIFEIAFGTGYRPEKPAQQVQVLNNTEGTKTAAYVQISQKIGELVLTAGVRGDDFSMIKDPWVVAPRFSASYDVLPTTTVNASIGRYYQSPSYIWLMANSYNHALTQMGMDQYVLGVQHYIASDLSIDVEGFLKNYDHYPVSLTRPYVVMVNAGGTVETLEDSYTSFGLDFLQSSGTGVSKGIELFLQKKVSETPVYGRASITYSDTRFIALDGVSRPSSFDQRWKIAITGGYILDENWEFNAGFHYASGRPYTPFVFDNVLDQFYHTAAQYNSARLRPMHGLDIRVSRRWVTNSLVINTFVDIQNIYNLKPQEPPEWNLATLTPEFPKTLGIIPSVGVSVEF